MSSGERPIGAAKGNQSDTEALCQTVFWRVSQKYFFLYPVYPRAFFCVSGVYPNFFSCVPGRFFAGEGGRACIVRGSIPGKQLSDMSVTVTLSFFVCQS